MLGIKKLSITVIITVLIFLYCSFLYLDFNAFNSFYSTHKLKYISILLCFLLSLMTMKHGISPIDSLLLQSGLFITTLADLCLLMLKYNTLGVALFCIVQIIYCIRYSPTKAYSTLVRFLIIFELIAIAYIAISFFIGDLDILFAVAFAYSICLTTSVVRAIKACKDNLFPEPNKYMISYGMILFLFCDINVAITNILKLLNSSSLSINYAYNTSLFLIWFFYLPSQVLLSMSGYDYAELQDFYELN